MASACWVCAGRGEGQLVLRPDGLADGRKVCRVCVRRLLEYLRSVPAAERAQALAPVWPGLQAGADAPAEADHLLAWGAFRETVTAALPGLDACARCQVALGYLELGSPGLAFEALDLLGQPTCEGLTDRLLTSLFSRLLHPAALSSEARELLERALYPGPGRA